MRVCLVAYKFYENSPRLRQFADVLSESGHTVDVVVLRRAGQSPRETKGNLTIHRIQLRTVGERSAGTYLLKNLLFLIRATLLLARWHIARSYDVVHVQNPPDFLVFASVLPRILGARVIFDVHDICPELYASKFQRDQRSFIVRALLVVERLAATYSSHVLVPNHIWFNRLVSRSARHERCTALCYAPDLRIFAAARQREDGKFIVLYPGTLNWHQGVDIAVRAFARALPEMPGAELHIYGEGPCEPELRELVSALGVQNSVRLHGLVPTSQIASIMANADLAVVPKRVSSTFGNEAISTKILELMALKVPVIASRTLVESFYFREEHLRFVAPEDEADLARAMVELWANPQLRDQLRREGYAYVRERDWAQTGSSYVALLSSLIESKNP